MNNIKTVICSVGDYSNYNNMNTLEKSSIADKKLIKESLLHGIYIQQRNIIDCSQTTAVSFNKFLTAIQKLNNSEISIFYLSGHGGIINGVYNFYFSDKPYPFSEIMEKIKKINSPIKIIFLDSCQSGTDIVENYFNSMDYNFEHENNDAYLFFASSAIDELSSAFSDGSLFTKCLSWAIDDNLNKNKTHTLFNIVFLTYLYLKKRTNNQNCMLRTNIIGDVFFHNKYNMTPLMLGPTEPNEYDFKIEELFEIEKRLIELYEVMKKNYIEYFSNETDDDELKNKLLSVKKNLYNIVCLDLQKYKCSKHSEYQECLDKFGELLLDFISTFTSFNFDNIYKHYRSKNNISEMAECIEKMKEYRLTEVN